MFKHNFKHYLRAGVALLIKLISFQLWYWCLKKTGIDKIDVTSFYDFFALWLANLHVSTTIRVNELEPCIDVDCFATCSNCFWISFALYFLGLNKLQISRITTYKLFVYNNWIQSLTFSLTGSSEFVKVLDSDLKKSAAITIQKAKDVCSSKSVTITYLQSIRITSYKVELIYSNLSFFLIWGQFRVHNK